MFIIAAKANICAVSDLRKLSDPLLVRLDKESDLERLSEVAGSLRARLVDDPSSMNTINHALQGAGQPLMSSILFRDFVVRISNTVPGINPASFSTIKTVQSSSPDEVCNCMVDLFRDMVGRESTFRKIAGMF